MTTEAQIQHDILVAFGARPGIRLWRTNVGRAKMGPRWVQFNPPGLPDINGILTVKGLGVAIGIEVKTEKGHQSEDQVAFQSTFNSLGALYVVARSVEDVEAAIAAFRARRG
jgi:hypothetical protein